MAIVNFYIETEDQAKLEQLLYTNGIAFYDATNFDPFTEGESCEKFPTLESIESFLELK